jgi:hypothetical protein
MSLPGIESMTPKTLLSIGSDYWQIQRDKTRVTTSTTGTATPLKASSSSSSSAPEEKKEEEKTAPTHPMDVPTDFFNVMGYTNGKDWGQLGSAYYNNNLGTADTMEPPKTTKKKGKKKK